LTSYELAFSFIIIYIVTNFFSLPQAISQVPLEEYSMNKTCSNSEIEPSQVKSGIIENGFLTYENVSLGFKIQYPSDWKRMEQHCILESQGLIFSSSIINLQYTTKSKEIGFVGVSVNDNNFKGPIDAFVDIYSQQSANIEPKQTFTFAGLPAAKFIINDGNNNRLNLITTFANDKEYDITYPNATRSFSDSTLQAILNSFEITNNTKSNNMDQENSLKANELG
jgi:hypothetical protein